MQDSATFTSNNFDFPAKSHHILNAGQGISDLSFNVPFNTAMPNMNGMVPHMNSHRLSGRRYSAGPTLSAVLETNEDNSKMANVRNNCSETPTGCSAGNVVGRMVGAQNNTSISNGPRYSLEMLIAALDTPSVQKHENQSQQETDFASCQPSQQQLDNAASYGNRHRQQDTQHQNGQWLPQNEVFGSSSDIVWRPWDSSCGYPKNPDQRATQSTDWATGYERTMGYNKSTNYAQPPAFCGQPTIANSVNSIQISNNNNDNSNHANHNGARTKQEADMTYADLNAFEMVNMNWMPQNQLGEQIVTDNVTSLDASAIPSPPNSAFYNQQKNSAPALQNPMRQQQFRQYANSQSMYRHQTPPSTILRTPPSSSGMQSYAHEPHSAKLLSRKRSVPNDESHLQLGNNNGSGTLSPAEEEMMLRKRSKSFDLAMILSNQGAISSRSSGQFLEASAFREHPTNISTYPSQQTFNAPGAYHGRAVTTGFIDESNHAMSTNPSSVNCHGQTTHPMFDPQAMAIAAHMKHPPPAQCGENIPSIPAYDPLLEETDGIESRPRRQNARYPGDLYTPQWVRYNGKAKEGFCDTCSPGKWLQLKNSAYWYHKQFFHGISSVSGRTFLNPVEQRVVEYDVVEGLCHQCNQWIRITNSKRKNCVLWYRHAHKCHIYHKPKNAVGLRKQF